MATADVEEADVVLLSIRSSSHMFGAVRLERSAGQLYSALRNNDVFGLDRQLPQLGVVGADTCLALSQHIIRTSGNTFRARARNAC